jgi:hypothetical protein
VIRDWKDYTDSNGLPVQMNMDGGDSAQRLGMIAVATAKGCSMPNLPSYDKISLLEVAPGIYIRNPTTWNNPNDFSRDQQTSLVIGMGFKGDKERLKRLFKAHASRFFKYQNADIASPENIGQYFRGLEWNFTYPFFWFSDLFMLGGVIIRCIQARDPNNVGDDLNLILSLLQAKDRMATPWSFLARKIYKWFRPFSIQYALDWYFRPETLAAPMNELYHPLVASELT